MNKQHIAAFFNCRAAEWDSRMVRNESAIASILDNGGIRAGVDVLDVACGTGVLFPDYLSRGVNSITGVDLSSEMVNIASKKFPEENVVVFCGDIETISLSRYFDCCIIYNAFPHFFDPANLIGRLARFLKPGGRLSVAHGMSRELVDHLHKGPANHVSLQLMSSDELATLFAPYFDVDIVIDSEQLYQVSGKKKQ